MTYAYGVFGERLAAFDGSTGQTSGRNVYFGSKLIATQTFSFGTLGMAAVARTEWAQCASVQGLPPI